MVIAGVVHLTILTINSWGDTTSMFTVMTADRFMDMSGEELRNGFDEAWTERMEARDDFMPDLGAGSYLDDVVYKFTNFFDMRFGIGTNDDVPNDGFSVLTRCTPLPRRRIQ